MLIHAYTHTHKQKDIQTALRTTISMNKRRFIEKSADINLDLTYICDRLIAMALPCVSDAVYRNDIREVARFFASRHYGRCIHIHVCVRVCACARVRACESLYVGRRPLPLWGTPSTSMIPVWGTPSTCMIPARRVRVPKEKQNC
jgi:hypothetical protein